MKVPANRLSNGIPIGWLTSPGPISGTAVQVNLSSLDRLLPSARKHAPAPNDIDMNFHDQLKGDSAHLGLIPFILEKFSFKKTVKLSEKDLNRRLESLIGSASAKTNRHSLLWSCSVPEIQIADSVGLIHDLSQGPGEFNDEDINEIYQMLKYESWEMRQELHFEDLLKDLIHRAAFSPSRTILSMTSPTILLSRESEDELGKDEICQLIKRATDCAKEYWRGTVLKRPWEHFCIVGSGAEESSKSLFESAIKSSFGGLNHSESIDIDLSLPELNDAYVGGIVNWNTNDHPLCNISIALKCPPSTDLKSHVPLAILQMLLGGGGSFSAGGPGKGMYSRLYTQMLNRYSWLEHARVFSQDYQSNRIGGLFGINASCLPERAPILIELLIKFLTTQLTASLTSTELSRAKNQLKSAILMGMESRHLMLENYAQQLSADNFIPVAELCSRIDGTSEEELRAAAKILATKSQLSVAAYGRIESVPSYKEISKLFTSQVSLMK